MVADGNNSKVGKVESCDVKKGKSLLSKRRRVYNVVSDDDDDTVADDNNVIKSLSSKGRRVFKGLCVDLIAEDNKVIKPGDGFSKFDNVAVGNECESLSTELKSVDTVYKCDKEYEYVPKKRTPLSRQQKTVNRFRF
nr:hypothetical protein [Tanacetum cinerariifolium]